VPSALAASGPQWASFVVAGVALVITLTRWYVDEYRRPRLSLEFAPEEDRHQDVVPLEKPAFDPSLRKIIWYRVRVSNSQRSRTAQDAQLLVRTISARDGRLGLDMRPLPWSGAYLTEESRERALSINLPPGVARHVDLVVWHMAEDGSTNAEIAVRPPPTAHGHMLIDSERVDLELWATAADAKSVRYLCSIEFKDGSITIGAVSRATRR
jgi:hypothetical protein